MRLALIPALILGLSAGVYAFQREFREYPAEEYNNFPLPSDYKVPADFVWARLMYPSNGLDGRARRQDWRQGRTGWTNDYPRAERHLLHTTMKFKDLCGTGKKAISFAEVPLAETFGYATDIRSMSQGQGTFTMELSCYRKVPAAIQEEIVAEKKKQAAAVGSK